MDYPELEKMTTVKSESQSIGCFLEWLGEQGIDLCEYLEDRNEYFATRKTMEQILADYFEIDLVKAEKERQSMLDSIRSK